MTQKQKNIYCLFLTAFLLISICLPVEAADQSGKIEDITGKVEIDGKKAQRGMAVSPNATIKTFENSFVEIVFNEKNIFKIFENSEAVLDLEPQQKSIDLKSGAIANLIKKLGALRDRFQPRYRITTAVAVAGVRGTAFFVKAEDKNNTYICVCNGIVELMNTSDSNKTIIAEKHHKAVRFSRDKQKTVLSPAKMLYHTDKGMENLATKINKKIDWNKIGTTEE